MSWETWKRKLAYYDAQSRRKDPFHKMLSRLDYAWWDFTNNLTIQEIMKCTHGEDIILDVGCGYGLFVKPLAGRRREVVGLDPLVSRLYKIAVGKEAESRIDLVLGVGEVLPFKSGVFDASLCAATLEHLNCIDRFMTEIRRVLKPNGLLFVKQGYERGKGRPGMFVKQSGTHLRSFTYDEIVKLVVRSGFELVKLMRIGYRPFWEPLRLLIRMLPVPTSAYCRFLAVFFNIQMALGRRFPLNAFLLILVARKS